ncbi:MAG: hypothetical protein Q8N23_33230 [Archangium sp.]|nr:hypothetical protein [Archangium sp.]MDP3157580.1 hypothetical protein [Archangium sp.]MDP3571980.1 hypothetical protein [Archangium sp.]
MARLLSTLLLFAASVSFAQEGGAVEPTPPPPAVEQEAVEPKALESTKVMLKPMPPPPTARQARSGTVGVGYLGVAGMTPLFGGLGGGLGGLGSLSAFRVSAPILGVRWWFRDSRLGLDLGLGAMVTAGSETSGALTNTPSLQLVAHAGLPIAIASTQHVIVLLAPELRAGYSTLLNDGSFALTGSLLELALRGAVELFFGFIGVPELSLEAAIRVGFMREAQGLSNFAPLGPGGNTLTNETFRFSTSLSGDAGSVIASTLSLKYYF